MIADQVLGIFAVIIALDSAVFFGAWLAERWWHKHRQRVG